MKINKITIGWVTQEYNSKTGLCTKQEFTAGDQVDYEDKYGEVVDSLRNEKYQPFDMLQPKDRLTEKYLKNPDLCPYCNSNNITGGETNWSGIFSWRNVLCKSCNKQWQEESAITKIISIFDKEE